MCLRCIDVLNQLLRCPKLVAHVNWSACGPAGAADIGALALPFPAALHALQHWPAVQLPCPSDAQVQALLPALLASDNVAALRWLGRRGVSLAQVALPALQAGAERCLAQLLAGQAAGEVQSLLDAALHSAQPWRLARRT